MAQAKTATVRRNAQARRNCPDHQKICDVLTGNVIATKVISDRFDSVDNRLANIEKSLNGDGLNQSLKAQVMINTQALSSLGQSHTEIWKKINENQHKNETESNEIKINLTKEIGALTLKVDLIQSSMSEFHRKYEEKEKYEKALSDQTAVSEKSTRSAGWFAMRATIIGTLTVVGVSFLVWLFKIYATLQTVISVTPHNK